MLSVESWRKTERPERTNLKLSEEIYDFVKVIF